MNRILIMEDDEDIKTELTDLLKSNGYRPVSELPCELALLDINLPEKNGYSICQDIRKTSDIPIIFLTAKNMPEDELLAFGVGGDDFIRKPYNSAVLLARIARLLMKKGNPVLTSKGITLNLENLFASYNGNAVELTKNEARILACLLKKELCTRDEIIEDLWSNSIYIDGNTLYVNMGRLRDKLKGLGADDAIKTVRGVGYRL